MKILYVYLGAGVNPGSVQRKVCGQINAFNSLNVSTSGLFFTTEQNAHPVDSENFSFIPVRKIKDGYFRSFRQKAAFHRSVFDYFMNNPSGYDLIYYRYPGPHRLLLRLQKLVDRKIFFEHVTSETEEIKLHRKENPLRFKLSSLLSFIEFFFLPMIQELLYGGRIRRNALFGVCNSMEISHYEKKRAGGIYETLILGDSVNASEFEERKIPANEGEFKMIFMKGASTGAEFNGLDRLFRGLRNYQGTRKPKLLIFGKNIEREIKLANELNIRDMVHCSGFIHRAEADKVMNEIHIGISALAVHRKGIRSTTTIKSREYFARGLPFIYGHADPDITPESGLGKYCLELEASETDIDLEKVINWYKELDFDEHSVQQMRILAASRLDYKVKIEKLLNYIRQIKPSVGS